MQLLTKHGKSIVLIFNIGTASLLNIRLVGVYNYSVCRLTAVCQYQTIGRHHIDFLMDDYMLGMF